jgi:hypothetical protein
MPVLLLSQQNAVTVGAPVNTSPPVASGTQAVGGTVSCTSGTWSFTTSISYAYQWQSSTDGLTSWADIAGAASSSYVIDVSQFGKFLRCAVTATDVNGSATEDSNLIGPAPVTPSQFSLVPNQDFVFQLTSNPSVRVRLVLLPNPNL